MELKQTCPHYTWGSFSLVHFGGFSFNHTSDYFKAEKAKYWPILPELLKSDICIYKLFQFRSGARQIHWRQEEISNLSSKKSLKNISQCKYSTVIEKLKSKLENLSCEMVHYCQVVHYLAIPYHQVWLFNFFQCSNFTET